LSNIDQENVPRLLVLPHCISCFTYKNIKCQNKIELKQLLLMLD